MASPVVFNCRLETLQGLVHAALAGLVAAANSKVTAGAVTVAKRPNFLSTARRSWDTLEAVGLSSVTALDTPSWVFSIILAPPI
jgi:hypothetical protein